MSLFPKIRFKMDRNAYKIEAKYFEDMHKFKVGLTKEEETGLAAKAKTDTSARNALIEANLPLVLSKIKEFPQPKNPHDKMDLIQYGNLGLCESAADSKRDRKGELRYDPQKGRFTTYAALWINQMIYRNMSTEQSATAIPYNLRLKLRKAIKLRHNYIGEHDKKPTEAWLIRRLKEIYKDKITDKEAKRVYKMSQQFTDSALKTQNYNIDDKFFSSLAHARQIYNEVYLNKDYPDAARHHDLEKLLSILPKQDKFLLKARYGIDGIEMTLKDLQKRLKITREAVRQREIKALKKLRQYALNSQPEK